MNQSATGASTPVRPSQADVARIEGEVSAIPDIQAMLVNNAPDLKVRDRVAHQYQIAGGKIALKIAAQLPGNLEASDCSGRTPNTPASAASRPASVVPISKPILI